MAAVGDDNDLRLPVALLALLLLVRDGELLLCCAAVVGGRSDGGGGDGRWGGVGGGVGGGDGASLFATMPVVELVVFSSETPIRLDEVSTCVVAPVAPVNRSRMLSSAV